MSQLFKSRYVYILQSDRGLKLLQITETRTNLIKQRKYLSDLGYWHELMHLD